MNHKNNENISRFGSLISIAVNIFIIYLINTYYDKLFFLNSDFTSYLPIINTTICVSIIGSFILVFINTKTFKHFVEIITSCFGIWCLYNLYKIFPFTLNNPDYLNLFKIIILLSIVGYFISIIVNIFKLLLKDRS